MKRLILLIFFFTAVYLLKAQGDSSKVWAVKTSIQIDPLRFKDLPIVQMPQIGLVKYGNINHEFGLNYFALNNRRYFTYDHFNFTVDLLYSIQKSLYESAKYSLDFSFQAIPSFYRIINTPHLSIYHKFTRTQLSLLNRIGLINSINLNSKLKLHIEVYNGLINYETSWQRIFNSALPKQQQRYGNHGFETMARKRYIRLGLSVLI